MIIIREEEVNRKTQNINEQGVVIDFDVFNNNMHTVSPAITIKELIELQITISKYIKDYVTT